MFGRAKNDSPSTSSVEATQAKDGGKGRPTPTRKEAEAAAKARAKSGQPRTRKEQVAADRLTRSESSRRARQGMKNGEERYLLTRDKGPVRRFIRDFVDARFSLVELMIPVLLVSMVLGYSGSTSARAFSSTLLMTMFLVIIVEMTLLRFRLRSQLRRRFPNESLHGSTWYAVMRAMQLRFMRMPKPQVKRGQALPETYR